MLKALLDEIKTIAEAQPNIKLVEIKDITYLNEIQNVTYPAILFFAQYNKMNVAKKQLTSTINIFAVDRETEDKNNKLIIQDWALSTIYNIVKKLQSSYILADNFTANTFEERLGSLCAGAYVTLDVTTNINDCGRA